MGNLRAKVESEVMLITNATHRLWTKDEYYRMAETGIFAPGERVELIEGEIVAMSPQNPPHAFALSRGNMLLTRLYGSTHSVRVQLPLDLNVRSQPEPDFALVPSDTIRADAHPTGADLVIEVAQSSLSFDRNEKVTLYARFGVPEYWIVDLVNRRVEVYREPQPDAQGPHGYAQRQIVTPDTAITPLVVPGPECPLADFFSPSS